MVTLTKYSALSGGEVYNRNVLWIEQLSSETKPIGTFIEYDSNGKEVARMPIPNGSILSEIDKGLTYKYDEENSLWYEFAVGGAIGDVYTKAETDALLTDKADLDNDGLIPLNQIPPAAMEHMVSVANDTARFALTTDDVQNGDTVYVESTELMYMVVDDEELDNENGYLSYAAGTASRAIADKNGNDITTTYALNAVVDTIKYDQSPKSDLQAHPVLYGNNMWSTKTWNGRSSFNAANVWTDGDNIYSVGGSYGNVHYILDRITSTWNSKSWNITPLFANCIWTDGDNIYHSYGSDHYVLDKTTNTWSAKTWNGLTSFSGTYIWNDGENIYYSNGSSYQYVLNKSTSTWSAKTWNGVTNVTGENIWTDGDNIYYSNSTYQYVLDKSTSTWSAKTWYGLTSFDGRSVWTDGHNLRFSQGNNQYILDKTTSTWVVDPYANTSILSGGSVWTDGDNIYYSDGSTQLKLNKLYFTAPKTHKQASDTINAMTGYSKAQADSAITTSDTLNAAMGKLEYKVDVNKANITSEQEKTVGMTAGGSNYITVGGVRTYVSSTVPTGTIPDGSLGIGF